MSDDPTRLAVGAVADPAERDEQRRFEPIAFEKARPVAERIAHQDRVQSVNVDAALLASELRRSIKGEVRFDDGSRALYSTDALNYWQVPIGVACSRASTTATARGG